MQLAFLRHTPHVISNAVIGMCVDTCHVYVDTYHVKYGARHKSGRGIIRWHSPINSFLAVFQAKDGNVTILFFALSNGRRAAARQLLPFEKTR